MMKNSKHFIAVFFAKHFKGGGEAYTIVLLGMVAAASYLVTGGLLPAIEQSPLDAEHVQIDDTTAISDKDNLQLVNIGIKTDEPAPTDEIPTPTEEPTPTDEPTPTTGPGTPTPTARPTRTPTPSRTPTPTPRDACLNKIAINLMLDVSTSMRSGDNIAVLNNAMNSLVRNNFKDNTVVGAVQFAGLASFPGGDYPGASTMLSYTRYKDNRTKVLDTLTDLSIHTNSANDGTYFRSAFRRSIKNIDGVKKKYTDQGYKFVTILFTDGVPETQYASSSPCEAQFDNPFLCFARNQNPTNPDLAGGDLAAKMKGLVSRVYTVGLYSRDREYQAIDEAREMLEQIASKRAYATSTRSPGELNELFEDIMESVCQ